ncbi:MAG: efflux RND transporter periplasmic adaptor subunit [Pirellulales bacterium]
MASTRKQLLAAALVGGIVGAMACAWFLAKRSDDQKTELRSQPVASQSSADAKTDAHLADGRPDTLILPKDVIKRLGVRIAEVEPAPKSRPLRLPGSLMLDPNRLARIHSHFEGIVMSLGTTTGDDGKPRPLRFGDHVKKSQTLAVVWSKEIGQKKSELLDAYSQFNLAKATLDKLKKLAPGEVSEHVMRDAQRNYESALINSQNGERTLRSWQLSEADVTAIKHEAERLHREGAGEQATAALREGWAELEVRAPIDGVLLEKNVTVGEIVDANLDLFKIGDVTRLMVVASAYEEDLAEIERLPGEMRKWKVSLTAEPEQAPLDGTFELAGRLIDPVQHTAQLVGWIENPQGRYIAGQFISARVELLPRKNEVAVPAGAVIESGEGAVLYTVAGEENNEFTRRVAAVAHRGRTYVHLRTNLTEDEQRRGFTTLEPGTRIVASGIVILESTWKELGLARAKSLTDDVEQLTRAE